METEKETEVWYAMRATYRREPDAMRLLEKENLTLPQDEQFAHDNLLRNGE